MTMPAHPYPVPLRPIPTGVLAAAGKSLETGDCYLAGWSFREATGTATVQFDLFDGNDSGGTLIASISLAAGESTRDLIGGHLLTCLTGVFVQVNSGSVVGSVWLADRMIRPRTHQLQRGA